MLYYDRIDDSDGIDIDKKKCIKTVPYLSLLVLFR